MNEAILKWLAFATIGGVVCVSLWLAGTVQRDLRSPGLMLGDAAGVHAPAVHRRDVNLAARPAERAASAVAVRAAFILE